jgi:hypothetical protein
MSSNLDKRHTRIDFGALYNQNKGEERAPSNLTHLYHAPVTATKGLLSPKADPTDRATGLKHLRLPTVAKSRAGASKVVKFESPWEKYEKSHEIRLGDDDLVTVADVKDPWSYDIALTEPQSPTPYLVTVRSIPAYNAEEKVHMLQRIQHENIVSVREIFSYDGSFYPIFEHMPMSLRHFLGIRKFLTERQLASVLGQGGSGR